MSYLTLAQLRSDTVQARDFARKLALRSPGDHGHGLVWTLFGDDPDATRDFLYREAEPGRLLIVSKRQPKGDETIWVLKSRLYAPASTPGQRLGFSLRANPTISLSQSGRARSLSRDVLLHAKKQAGRPLSPEEREEVCLAWLEARASQLGVKLDRDLSHVAVFQQLRISRKNGKAAKFLAVDFEGVLAVEDPHVLGPRLDLRRRQGPRLWSGPTAVAPVGRVGRMAEATFIPLRPIPMKDRSAIVFLSYGQLDVLDGAFVLVDQNGVRVQIPVGGLACLMLEPGTRVSHAAVVLCAQVGCLLVWVGEGGVRLYAVGQPGGARADRLLFQARNAWMKPRA